MMPEALLVIAVLLVIGLCCRAMIPWLARASIPASVIAGIIGLLIAQGFNTWIQRGMSIDSIDRPRYIEWYQSLRTELGSISDLAIAVVFAGLLLLPQRGKIARSRHVWQQGLAAWIIILGQLALGLLITAIFIAPRYQVPAPFGQLIEVTMAGGFGSAKAMGTLLGSDIYHFPQGADILIFGATFGLLFGIVTGIPFAKLGARRGWTSGAVDSQQSTADSQALPIAKRRVGGDAVDPLLLQGVFLVISIGVGVGMKYLLSKTVAQFDIHLNTNGQFERYLGDLPLFFFALLGGWIVRVVTQLLRIDSYLDDKLIHRFTGSAIDILIVASLARVQFTTITTYLLPTMLLLIAGAIWSIFCLFWLSRKLLPKEYWFELGLINYGFSTAATAQGMMFLRLVDKDLKSGAAETYALAAPITAPFIGGGVITFAVLPPLLSWAGAMPVAGFICVIGIAMYFIARRIKSD